MKTDVKDVRWCMRGMHSVPRDEMTQMLSDNGKVWLKVCIECKDKTIDRRKRAKAVEV